MKINQAKVKLFVIVAVAIIALLLLVTLWQIFMINKTRNDINSQRARITELQNEIDYYKNNNQTGGDVEIGVNNE